jgi:hypothetical protein
MDVDQPAPRRASPEVVEIMDSDDDEHVIAGPADLIQLLQLTWRPLQMSPARAEISCVINHLVSFQCVTRLLPVPLFVCCSCSHASTPTVAVLCGWCLDPQVHGCCGAAAGGIPDAHID